MSLKSGDCNVRDDGKQCLFLNNACSLTVQLVACCAILKALRSLAGVGGSTAQGKKEQNSTYRESGSRGRAMKISMSNLSRTVRLPVL